MEGWLPWGTRPLTEVRDKSEAEGICSIAAERDAKVAKVAKVALLKRARDRAEVAGWVSENRISGLRIGESMRL